jgi:predicted ATPase
MAITNLKVSNFKSFKDLDLNLGRFNVLVGANASGKSNLVEIFRFLRDIEVEKLSNAVFMHGGPSSLLNRKIGGTEDLSVKATSDSEAMWTRQSRFVRVCESTYELTLHFGDESNGMRVVSDALREGFRMGTLKEEGGQLWEDEITATGDLWIRVVDGQTSVAIEPPDAGRLLEGEQILLPTPLISDLVSRSTEVSALVQARYSLLAPRRGFFSSIGIYGIAPHLAKEPSAAGGKPELQEDGKNLAVILRQILTDPERSRMFHNLLRYMLPFAREIGTEQYLGDSVLLRLREEYYEGDLLANLLSDGTVNVAALIVALFFEDKDVVIIEEPERNIHPRLISGLIELMKDAARNKQIIVTTHSPELVKHAGIENLLLISRDQEGFSSIARPAEKEAVKIFLQHDLGLDDLFVQDLLAVP